LASVVIAAYNEATVLGRCLDALRPGLAGLEVVVAANGCSDATADVARAHSGVLVVELAEAGKARALNAGDAVVRSFPRAYLDADITVDHDDLHRLFASLGDRVLAVAPSRDVDVAGCPLLVRSYYAVHRRLPVMATGLFGRGLIVVSEGGRARFAEFPELVADDLFLDALFEAGEKRVVPDVVSTVRAPRRTVDLFRRLVRVRRGNAVLRSEAGSGAVPSGVAHSSRSAFLLVAVRHPWLVPAAAWYATITVAAALVARRSGGDAWGRDESTRAEAS
jgi:glycosyltransferase involved in cell wall biosynthesis